MTYQSNVIAFHPSLALPVLDEPALYRPRLLVVAARLGQKAWRRNRDLRRVLRLEDLPGPKVSLNILNAEEARLNAARQQNAAEYDLQRHVLVLIALLSERRALAAVLSAPETESRARL